MMGEAGPWIGPRRRCMVALPEGVDTACSRTVVCGRSPLSNAAGNNIKLHKKMKTLQLKAVKRADFGKKAAKALRREGLVPCMIYGGGEEVAFTVDAKEVKPLIYTPNSYIVELDIDGKVEKAVMREVQFHPVREQILHIDFYRVQEGKPVAIAIPVRLNGTAEGVKVGLIDIGGSRLLTLFFEALTFTFWCMGIPYLISCLYLSLADKSNTMRLTDYGDVVSDAPAKPYEDKKITLFDNNGALKFSVSSENLYFIESDDNYIRVWYSDSSGQMKQYMLRCRLKTVEDSFSDSDLVRCHRKYIVNIAKVRILKAEKEGYKISFGIDGVGAIPISRTYEKNVLARFNSKTS